MCAFHRGLTVGGRRLLCLGLFSMLMLAGRGSNAGESGIPFPAPGRWEGRFANEFEVSGSMVIDLEKDRNGYSGTCVSTSDDGTEGPPATIIGGEKSGKNFVLTGEIWLPVEGGDTVPGWLTLTGAAKGDAWNGTFRITDEDDVINIGGEFALTKSGGIAHRPDSATAPGDLPAEVRLRRHVIIDQAANSIPAMTVYLPADWQFEGNVFWDLQSYIYPARVGFQAKGPKDGVEALLIPMMIFSISNPPPPVPVGRLYAGTIVKPPMTSEALLRELFPNLRPQATDVRVISVERPDGDSATMQDTLDKLRAQARAAMQPNQPEPDSFDYDLAVMTVTYTENGQAFEERLVSVILYAKNVMATQMLDARARPYMARFEILKWTCFPILSVRAHRGKLQAHELEFDIVANNVVQDPTWTLYVDAIGQKLIMEEFRQAVITQEKIRESIIATHDYVMQRRREAQANFQASQDRINQRRVDDIRGVERYNTRESTGVALPSGYSHVWESRDGTVIMQNDPFFNPNLGSTKDWQKIERIQ